jgi:hypothetical protein
MASFHVVIHHKIKHSFTYGHSQLKTGHPVRSAIHKQLNGRLVLRWVTTWESLLLYVLWVCNLHRFSWLKFVRDGVIHEEGHGVNERTSRLFFVDHSLCTGTRYETIYIERETVQIAIASNCSQCTRQPFPCPRHLPVALPEFYPFLFSHFLVSQCLSTRYFFSRFLSCCQGPMTLERKRWIC